MDPAKVTSQLARYEVKFGTIENRERNLLNRGLTPLRIWYLVTNTLCYAVSTVSLAPRLSVKTPPSSSAITVANEPPTPPTIVPAMEPLDPSQVASHGEPDPANTRPEAGVRPSPAATPHAIDGLEADAHFLPSGEGIVASPLPSPSRVADTIAEYLPMDANGSMDIDINDWTIPELDAGDDWLNFDYGLFGSPVATRLKLLADLPWFNLQRTLSERRM